MGGRGRGRSRTQRKHFQQNRENVWKRSKSDPQSNDGNNEANTHWEPFATKNEAFDEYYKGQGIVAPEEWNSFNEYLRKPLPAAFRVNSSSQFHMEIRSQLENDFMKSLQSQDEDGMDVVALKPLLWYPDNLAWQSNYSRNQLRKNQNLERFHEFLKLENEIGNITRQEAVSMVPPLFLDVHPDHVVLDMCAAPGSKTFQLLEMIYKLTEPGSLPSGMVIANDLDVQRCNLLIHQTKRMCTANLIVTNHNAQHFPSCHLHRNHSIDSQSGKAGEPAIRQLQFDRILCDVPCSGDGTLRKAPDIWKKWNSGMGNGIHALQVQIASRGIALLKVGGRMVYSTCSMNPVENEAVVAEILRQWSGAIELLDVSEKLPQLARRQGLKSWKVWDKGLWLTSCEDVPKYRRSVITPSMFPSGKAYKETVNSELETEVSQSCGVPDGSSGEDHFPLKNNLDAEVSDLPLDRCMRIVPHDQNSGAFFIAVFQKVSTVRDALNTQKASTHPPQMDNVIENMNSEVSESNLQDDHVDAEMNGDPLDSIQSDVEENGKDELEENIKDETEENAKDEPEPSVNVKIDAKLVAGKRKLQIQGRWRGVDPVIFYKDEKVVNSIFEFYGIVESFPLKGHVITRNNDTNHVKRIYYISSSVKEVLELNFLANQQLKIASVGLKMFERQTSREGTSTPCMFRISSEGLPLILPHMTKQILHVQALDFKHLLQYKSIKFPDFVDPELREQVTKLMLGCCVVVLSKDNRVSSHSSQVDAPIAIGCWRGRNSISVMVNATDCQELLERVSLLVSVNESVSSSEVLPDAEAAEAGNPNGS